MKYDKTKFTHTFYFIVMANNTIEDMALEAIQKGFTSFGFFRTWELSTNR